MPDPANITIQATDGHPLVATLYRSIQPNGRAIVINSAMGVPRTFYNAYADFLSGQGFHVLTYDYRGIGGSLSTEPDIQLSDWGVYDQVGAIDYLATQFPDDKLLMVGHSVGGQLLGLASNHTRVVGMLGIAAQTGYWGAWQGNQRVFMLLLWTVIIPAATFIFGRLPHTILGGKEDIPKGVATEWARAGRMKRYLYALYAGEDFHFYDDITIPIRAYSFSDDTSAPSEAVERLVDLYPNVEFEFKHTTPSDNRAEKIGHFGFFRKQFAPNLWIETAVWLRNL